MVRGSGPVLLALRRLRAAGLGEIGDASVYGTLRRLYRDGALTSYVVPSDEGPHRRYYGITAAVAVLLGDDGEHGRVERAAQQLAAIHALARRLHATHGRQLLDDARRLWTDFSCALSALLAIDLEVPA